MHHKHTETLLSHEIMSSTKPSEKGTIHITEMHSMDLPEKLLNAANRSPGPKAAFIV